MTHEYENELKQNHIQKQKQNPKLISVLSNWQNRFMRFQNISVNFREKFGIFQI